MGDLLQTLSQIPDCIPAQPELGGGESLRGQLHMLNHLASQRREASASDDSFTREDFAYARKQRWGRFLNEFGSYANFRSVLTRFIDREMQTNIFCTCTGEVTKTPEGLARCHENPGPIPSSKPTEKPTQPSGKKKSPPPSANHRPPAIADDPPLPEAQGPALGENSWWNRPVSSIADMSPTPNSLDASLPSAEDAAADHSIAGSIQEGVVSLSGQSIGRKILNVALAQTRGRGGLKGKNVDVVFAIDHSGSMEPAAQSVRDSVHHVISVLKQRGVKEVRIGLVGFSDSQQISVLMHLTPMDSHSVSRLRMQINSLVFRGGREPVGLAAKTALQLMEPVENPEQYARQVIVMTDWDGLRDSQTYDMRLSDATYSGGLEDVAVNLYMVPDHNYLPPPKSSPVLKHIPQLNSLYMFFQNPAAFYYYNKPPKAWGSRP